MSVDPSSIGHAWPLLVVMGVLGAVALAFCRCAVAELVIGVAARLYSADPEVRAERREEWLRHVRDMTPAERPAHAGSLLWEGVLRSLAARSREDAPAKAKEQGQHLARRTLITVTAALAAVAAPVGLVAATSSGWPH